MEEHLFVLCSKTALRILDVDEEPPLTGIARNAHSLEEPFYILTVT